MIEYIRADLVQTLGYLPYGLAAGLPAAIVVVWLRNALRRVRRKPPLPWMPAAAFCVYVAMMLIITFWSRESGSRPGKMDLALFSTWGKSNRSRAFVLENILLFIPYGSFFCWNLSCRWRALLCVLSGAAFSLGIETMQLMTARGYFQLDDIVTNTLGALIGALVFALVSRFRG